MPPAAAEFRPAPEQLAALRARCREVARAGTAPPALLRPPPLPAAAATARLAACRACPHLRPETDRCGLCGCGDTVARRAASPWASCPDGRWQ